ncbi:transposase [Chromobacterium phragmitis]|nr:transposase [Chromobacterium amazonense]
MRQQMTFTDLELAAKKKRTRREIFLAEMDQVMPWAQLEAVIDPVYPKPGNGRRPYPLSAMLRVYCLQHWYSLSDPAMEESLYEIASMRQFAGLSLDAIPDETTLLNFRQLLEKHQLTHALFAAIHQHLCDSSDGPAHHRRAGRHQAEGGGVGVAVDPPESIHTSKIAENIFVCS